jgi:hypothetical protein
MGGHGFSRAVKRPRQSAALDAEEKILRSVLEEEVTVELQHINVKLLLKDPENIALDSVIPIFHSWIQEQIFDELLLDVAEYRHVKHGPGLMLIGHEADYSLDNTGGLLGVRYNRKAPLAGTNLDRLIQATRSALLACQRLESDTRLNGKFHFNGRDVQLIINDRLLAPNNEQTRQAAAPDFQLLANKLFAQPGSFAAASVGESTDELIDQPGYSLSYSTDPRRLLSATIRASNPLSTGELLNNLAS